jgi:hypothetical protein
MGNPIIATRASGVRVVASASTWIEGEALRQLDAAGALIAWSKTGSGSFPKDNRGRRCKLYTSYCG